MLRMLLGIVAGVIAWPIALDSSEQILSALWPKFGAQHRAFFEAIDKGSPFAPETSFLATHIVIGSLAALLSGVLTAILARENRRSPLIVGVFLLNLGLMKAVMSWLLVPLWYHIVFTAVLLPMTMIGGRLTAAAKAAQVERIK